MSLCQILSLHNRKKSFHFLFSLSFHGLQLNITIISWFMVSPYLLARQVITTHAFQVFIWKFSSLIHFPSFMFFMVVLDLPVIPRDNYGLNCLTFLKLTPYLSSALNNVSNEYSPSIFNFIFSYPDLLVLLLMMHLVWRIVFLFFTLGSFFCFFSYA